MLNVPKPNLKFPFFTTKEKHYSFLLLFLLLFLTFHPLLAGKNFIPFGKYPQAVYMMAKSSGQSIQVDYPAIIRFNLLPEAEEPEFGAIVLNWAENIYFARNLKEGRVPLWDPYTGGGIPTIDGGQSRPLNPFRLPFYLLPTSWMYSITLFLGLIFGGIGAHLWLSKQNLSPAAVFLGTGLFLFNPWVLERLVLTDAAAYFVFPWCLLTLEIAVWRSWPSICRAALCFILMGHTGHPVVCVMMAGVAITLYLFGKEESLNNRETLFNRIKITGVVSAITLVSLSVLWLPLLKMFAIGDFYKRHGQFLPIHRWGSLITLPSHTYLSPAVVVMCACALFVWRKFRKGWIILFLLTVLLSFPLPGVGDQLQKLINQIGLSSYYLKWVFWGLLFFIAAYGLDVFRGMEKRKALSVFAIGIAMFIATGWQATNLPIGIGEVSAYPVFTFVLLAFGLISFLLLYYFKGTFISLLLTSVILFPLAYPLSLNKLSWNDFDFKTNPVIEWLKTNRPNVRVASVDPNRIFPIYPNLGQAYGVRCVEVISVFFPNHYRSMFHHPKAILTGIYFDFISPEVLKHMGASVILLQNTLNPSGLELLFKGSHFSAYSIPESHGRLYFAQRASHHLPDKNFPEQILLLGQETDAIAVVEAMGNRLPSVIPEVPPGMWKAVFEQDDANKITIRTECPMEGFLVLRDSWYPGWVAFIDGNRVPIFRVNGCFRGLLVPPGTHTVRFIYRPVLVWITAPLSFLLSLLVIGISLRKNSTSN